MPTVELPNLESRRIAKWAADLEARIGRVEAGLRSAQLGNSSLNGTGIDMFDTTGNFRGTVGIQRDGNPAVTVVNNKPPPVPNAPQVLAGFGPTLIVKATGETNTGEAWPADWLTQPLYKVYYADVINPTVWTLGGTITAKDGETPIGPLEYTQFLVSLTSISPGTNALESAKSPSSSGTATKVVSDDLINGIIQEIHLNADIVGAAQIKANAVTATKISDDAVETRHLIAGAVTTSELATNSVNAAKIVAGSITGDKIQALTLTANEIAANAISAGKIQAGAVSAIKLEANLVLASRVIAGSATGARVEMHPTSGLQAFQSNGTTRTFWIDAATGQAFFMGQIATAASGARIILNPNNTQPDRIQFWPDAAGGANNAAYIDSFPEGAVDTGITMQASGGASTRVGTIWLRKAFAQLGMATTGLVSNSLFYAEPNYVRSRSAVVDLIVDQSVSPLTGDRRVAILNYNSSGSGVANSAIYYVTGTGNQYGMLWAPNTNVSFIFDNGFIGVVANDGAYTRITIEASQFRVGSAQSLKENIGDIPWKAKDVVRGAPSKRYKFKSEKYPPKVPTEDLGYGIKGKPQRAKRGIDGKVIVDGFGDTIFEDTPVATPDDAPWHFGPMADLLPAELQQIGEDGIAKVSIMDMIGVLWKHCEELQAQIDAMPGPPK